jgi:methionyl-tRNA synthetase
MKSALQSAMMISKSCNLFFQETEIWKVVKENRDTAAAYISTCFGTSVVLASLLEPFMPSLTAKILDQMNLDSCPSLTDDLIDKCKSVGDIVAEGHKLVKEPVPIFKKITEEEVSELRARYAGSQASRVEGSTPSDAKQKEPESKKDKGKKEKKEAKGAKEELSSKMKKMSLSDKSVDISRIDIRVGKIVECKKHPDADSLYVETVDVGEEKPRTVVSGLVKFIPLEQMQNRRVVLVCNLKPANMRGIKSEAMVLAATAPDGNSVELVEPPASAEIGSRIHVEGYEGEADDILNPKKKVWEKVQVDLGTNDAKQACYKGVPFSGPCTVASIVNGSIK